MRSVPRFGSQIATSARPAGVKPTGQNLQWRQSKNITQVKLRRSSVEPRLSKVSQIDWQSPAGETLIPPPSASRPTIAQAKKNPNYFSDPFGDDPLPMQGPTRSNPTRSNQNRINPVPTGQGEQLIAPPTISKPAAPTLPNELRSSEELRKNMFDRSSEPLRDPEPIEPPRNPEPIEPLRELEPPTTVPEPLQQHQGEPFLELPEPKSEPSLGERLRSERPERSAPVEQQELPPLRRDDSKDEAEEENPFDLRDSDSRDRDDQQKDRFNFGDDDDGSEKPFDGGRGLEEENSDKPQEITCNDFRQRIAEQTIDQVSLDISPPYRPDEIDIDRFLELKEDFDEKQAIRDWRAIDGRPIASGRLRDLAYEKAVIETDQGELQELQLNRISEADLAYIAENWGLPSECLLEQIEATPRNWVMSTMTWKASNLCHTPLYFEDVNLERYGHTRGPLLEPLVQSAHFFGNVLVLPYKMGVHSPTECQYALGYYRPGNCAPWVKPPLPISAKGALTQAVTMTGLFWLIP